MSSDARVFEKVRVLEGPSDPYSCFHNLGLLLVGVLAIRALLLGGIYLGIRGPLIFGNSHISFRASLAGHKSKQRHKAPLKLRAAEAKPQAAHEDGAWHHVYYIATVAAGLV